MKYFSLKTFFITISLLVTANVLMAQQETSLTLYRYHMNVINPAVVGVDGESWVNATLRRQWTDIPDAPETAAVSLGLPMGNKLGMGLSVIQDKVFVDKQTGVFVDFSYRVQLSEASNIYFGLKAGGTNFSINASGLETYNVMMDPSLSDISQFNPNIGVGAYFTAKQFYFSLSSPRLLTTDSAGDQDGTATVMASRAHVYASSGYDFQLSDNVVLSPSFLMRYVKGVPVSVDLFSTLTFFDSFSVGASYRTDQAIAGIVSLKLAQRFTLGYAYESATRDNLRAAAGNTHEIVLRYLFGKKSNTVQNQSSPVVVPER
ncbi:type IX secretion system membrane protein PorP/SprF [Flagellimonas marinaquae]|uniref:PorP/SprF family type IX secretion system membrane protein n=1 Tax=Flagellimonas marinaquae TaxID=254955 RepID=UPI000F8E3C3A|nr:type IX secretion system membrane protein PorP/SprF [Allomuricauda aquimarina]